MSVIYGNPLLIGVGKKVKFYSGIISFPKLFRQVLVKQQHLSR